MSEALVEPPESNPPPSRRLVVVSAGLRQPSSTRLLADRLTAATENGLREAGIEASARVIEVRDHAQDLVNNVLTLFPGPDLRDALEAVRAADGLIAAGPVFSGSYSGLFKLFFDVLDQGALAGLPVLVAATGGTPRHTLALDHAFRPLFAYLGALVLPTGVYAAAEDWGRAGTAADPALATRIDRAGRELAEEMARRPARQPQDPWVDPPPLEGLPARADVSRRAGSKSGSGPQPR